MLIAVFLPLIDVGLNCGIARCVFLCLWELEFISYGNYRMKKDYNCCCHSLLRIEEIPLLFGFVCHPSALSNVCGAYNGVHTAVLHQTAQKVKLFFLILWHFIFPGVRHNRQIRITPFGILFPVGFGLGQFQKVPHAPAHQITVSLQVPVLFLICTQYRS